MKNTPTWLVELRAKRDRLALRASIIKKIRHWFDNHDFTEMHTPRLVPSPGLESNLDVFSTIVVAPRNEGPDTRAWLPTSPEFSMKKLLAAGFERIYDLGVCFRNAEGSELHEHEFLMLEWYRTQADETDIMNDCEAMVYETALAAGIGDSVTYKGRCISLKPPWTRTTFAKLFANIGIDLGSAFEADNLAEAAIRQGFDYVRPDDDFDTAFYRLFLTEFEPNIGWNKPVFINGYPACMAAYARLDENDPRFSRRFELFMGGIELANAFYEVTDPEEQRRRQQKYREERTGRSEDIVPEDPQFMEALEAGFPRSGGIALGVDRLVMLLAGQEAIQDILPFPRWRKPE